MIPAHNAHITIFFRTGIQLSGIVISWSDQKSVLKSLSGAQTIVIQNTLSDILFYKYTDGSIEKEYQEIVEKPIKTQDDILELADLKNQLNDLEREEIREKLRSHIPTGTSTVSYGSLPIAAIKQSQQHPPAQNRSQGSGIGSELSNLFAKKDK